jgi:outer membrane protein OmpA-like peptidoglycan-associated protein/tetratricopeptide (TPR) repeat protein
MKKKSRFTLLIPAILLLTSACSAQKPADFGIKSKKAMDLFLKGIQQQEWRDYNKAFSCFDEAITLEPEFGEAYFRAGACQYTLQAYEKAQPYLEKAATSWASPSPLLWYYLAEVYFLQDRYEAARDNYKKFLDEKPVVPVAIADKAKVHYENARFATEAIKHPIAFEPKNMGAMINSPYSEYLPYLTADEQTIFLTGRRPESIGGYSAEIRDFAEDFFYAEMKNGEWQQVKNFGEPVNTEMNEGAACFTPDGQFVYFTACNRNGGFGDCDLYVSRLEGTSWSTPKNLGPLINTSSWESQPCISHDGNQLYFSSNRPGGLGQADIWVSKKVNGAWTEPTNLGKPINTPGKENCPFLHADGNSLYFSSDGLPGMGNLDLYLSRGIDGVWGIPENLGYPLNTSGFEGNLFINAQGTVGYMNSDRRGTLGKSDIFSFQLDERIQPSFTTYVRGLVSDRVTLKELNAKIVFINIETGDTVRSVFTNELTGKFLLTLPVDQDYAAFVDAKGYLFASRNFSLKGLAKNKNQYYDLEILLDQILVGETVVLNNIFYETAKFNLLDQSQTELNHLVRFLKVNPSVKIEIGGHTDKIGTDADNKLLSERRSGEVKNYLVTKGIAADRITAMGYGESKPVCAEETEECHARNRRTEFKVTAK